MKLVAIGSSGILAIYASVVGPHLLIWLERSQLSGEGV